eukprot:EG_transcript_24279
MDVASHCGVARPTSVSNLRATQQMVVLVEASPGHQQSLGSVHPGAGLSCSTGCVCTNELNQELCMVVFDGKSVPKSSMLHHLLLGVKKLLTAQRNCRKPPI